ncbi:MAG: hypothetical protein A2V70_14370 [Planctomycetes bacterium RBG_13_63_9]|nr:MAG: hypothetical protein A2V70_14370 [Planctomycetes bacterium RBG_13_63_9]
MRIVAATSRRLGEEVNAGRFRLDLYYRLNVVRLETMPLCEHPEDVELLCRHFLNRLSVENGLPQKKVSPSGIRALSAFHWPGNVRQLQNVLERAVVFVVGDEITDRHVTRLLETEMSLPPTGTPATRVTRHVDTGSSGNPPMSWGASSRGGSQSWPSLAESERRLIKETLERTFYNQSAAARLLDVDRRLLARKIRKYDIAIPSRRRPAHSG